LQRNLNIVFRILILIGLFFTWQPGLTVRAQTLTDEQARKGFSVTFLKPEIHQKAGDLSFNIIKAVNRTDSAVRIKPYIVFPQDWALFSAPYDDTLVNPHDSISLIYRFKLPENLSSELNYDVIFRAYSQKNQLLAESSCKVFPEPIHNWDMYSTNNRIFFPPRKDMTSFSLKIENKGNTTESVDLLLANDKKIEVSSTGDWKPGEKIVLDPFQDTLLNFSAKYVNPDDRVFDLSKLQIQATAGDKMVQRPLMIERYSDVYAPFIIDRTLPHMVEAGIRTFSRNQNVLPFIKARGVSSFKNQSTFFYNFNYYSITGNENFISNTYYNFLYNWKSFKIGLGAFSSELGRNMYTRNGLMVSNTLKITPNLYLEAFLCQSILTHKTSIATGFSFQKKKIDFHGSIAYDLDFAKKVKTGSVMLQSGLIPIFKHQNVNFNIYGYNEYHDLVKDYTLSGIAYDLSYLVTIGEVVGIQFTNNYGSPNVPGPQMGLLNLAGRAVFLIGDRKKNIAVQYVNTSRKYYSYNFDGEKLPTNKLYDQYSSMIFQNNNNPDHIWEAGPSVESYISYRPSQTVGGVVTEFRSQKIRFEYKANIYKRLTVDIKTGLSDIHIIDTRETKEQRYDFHLLGGYSFGDGYGISLNYDYGPMVNSGLYQFSGDAKNHSINISPSASKTFLKKRLNFFLFAGFTYRFDLDYGSININPKIEAYLFRDWYLVMSGTYHYNHQEYPEFTNKNSYFYLECSIRKRFGKSDYNKWQKGTRQLKVIMFKDDNGNGVKDEFEQGVPFVKARLVLTNTDNPNISTQFPVDITLLSNEKGQVTYNMLPTGFYDLSIIPLSDVKEYFYVNRSVEKIEVTKNSTYFVPFQKATKLTGKLVVQRQKFIKKGTENMDLKNIRITAYDNQENSYSSFTLEDGTFTIFVPGNNTYYMRMGNVFGPDFKIVKNDIPVVVTDTASEEVVFNIQEINRQVKFKETKPATADTAKQAPLKIKVLQGKFYENSAYSPADKNAAPEFNIKEAPVNEEPVIPGKYYVVIGAQTTRAPAVQFIRIVDENGIKAHLSYVESEAKYYVFTSYFDDKAGARAELEKMKLAGLNEAVIIRFQ
jgi:hypothetical protein